MPRRNGIFEESNYTQEDTEINVQSLDCLNDAVSYVQSKGISLPPKPINEYTGDIPKSLSLLADHEIMDLLYNIGQYCGYVEMELALADVRLNVAKEQYDFLAARIRIGIKAHSDSKVTDKDRTDLVVADPSVKDATLRVIHATACYGIIKAVLARAQRNWNTLSRTITQRGQEIERMKREINVAGIPVPGRHFNRPNNGR